MKKTLSLLLSLVLVIGLFPVFADDMVTQEQAGSKLESYGAIKGNLQGDLMIQKKLKRQDALVILSRLMGKEEEVKSYEGKHTFKDVADPYYNKVIAYAQEKGWTTGKTETKFGFNDLVTAHQFSAFLLRALGYTKEATGDNYSKAMDLAKEKNLLKGVEVGSEDEIVRGTAFVMMYNTLEQPMKDGKEALKYVLKYEEKPAPKNLAVVEAMSMGLKNIHVKFTKEVDEKTLDRIVVKKGSDKLAFKGKVSEDKMAACLVLDKKVVQDTELKVIVENVKSADKKETVEKFEGMVTMSDTTKPEVKSVEAVNAKLLKVMLSEAVDLDNSNVFKSYDEFKVDGKKVYAKLENEGTNEISLILNKALTAGDHKVEVMGLKDFAGFKSAKAEFDVTVVEDKNAPVAVEAKMVDTKTVMVMFDEPLNQKGSFKVNGNSVSSMIEKDNKKSVKLSLSTALGMGAIVEVKVQYKGQEDLLGNRVKDEQTFTFKVDDDTALPTVVKTEVKEGGKIEVTFDKSMDASTGKAMLKKGKSVVSSNLAKAWKEDNTVLELTASYLVGKDPAEYTLVLEKFKDGTVRANELGKQEISLTGLDENAPKVIDNKFVWKAGTASEKATIKIVFSEQMDNETVTNMVNYTLDNARLDKIMVGDNKAKIEVVNNNDAVLITLPLNYVFDGASKKIKLVGLKDASGKAMADVEIDAYTAAAIAAPTAKVHEDNDGNQYVVLTFTKDVMITDVSGYKVGTAVANYEGTLGVAAKEHKFTSSVKFDGEGKVSGAAVNFTVVANTVTNAFGDKNTGSTPAIEDGIGPKFVKKELNAGKDTVTFTFDENVASANVIIEKGDIGLGGLVVNTAAKTITVKRDNSAGKFEDGATYKYKVVAVDAQNNTRNIDGEFTVE